MAVRITKGRLAVALAALACAAAVAFVVARGGFGPAAAPPARPPTRPPVALEFGAGDLAYLDARADVALAAALRHARAGAPGDRQGEGVGRREVGVGVQEGESVRAGQLLATIDTADLEARLIEKQGALESARAQFALAEKTRANNVKLLNEKFISQTAFDSSQSGFDVAKGGVKSAEAQVRLAENALKDANVIAPIAGMVAKRHAQPGEKVAFDAPIVTVVDLTSLELQALVPAIDVPGLSVGMTVELAVDGFGERRFTGRIARINPSTEPGTRAILVYVALGNPDAALRSGMFANGRVALVASAPIAALPQAAVRTEAGQSYVWVVDNGKLARRVVPRAPRRGERAGRDQVGAARDPAGARDALREPEGRRARAGARGRTARDRRRARARRRRAVRPAGARRTPGTVTGSSPDHVDHQDLDPQPGVRDHGDGRDHRARRVLVQPPPGRADAGGEPAVRDDPDQLPGRGARGGGERRHEADRVRGEPGGGRQAHVQQLARGLEPGVRRVPDVDGRASRRSRTCATRSRWCGPGSRATSRNRSSSAPTTRTTRRSCRSRSCRRRPSCASSRRSPTRRSSRRSRTCPASRASTSTAGSRARSSSRSSRTR